MPKIIGENIDRLCNIEYRPAVGSQRGDIMRYYNAAREVQKDPLSYLCAKALMDRVKEGDTVLFVTGARFPHLLPYGETDGPLGVAALAKAVERGLGAKTVVTVEESNDVPTRGCLMGVGCNVRDLDEWKITDGACYLDWYPLGSEKGPEHAKYLVETFKPKAIVFCEKHGPNEVGYCHSVHGARIPPEEFANTWHLLDEAKKHGILTIGTGDGGNEMGMGTYRDVIEHFVPFGGTICTAESADITLASGVSNWWGIGIAALCTLFAEKNLLPTREEETESLRLAVAAGSVDGCTKKNEMTVDRLDLETHLGILDSVNDILKKELDICAIA